MQGMAHGGEEKATVIPSRLAPDEARIGVPSAMSLPLDR